MTNPRSAGKKNEREVCSAFSDWTGWVFRPVPRSGGLHWANDQRVTGDIVCQADHADEFPFTVETKRRKAKKRKSGSGRGADQINLTNAILDWDDWKVLDFWEQAIMDASRVKKEPLLLLRNVGMIKGLYFIFMDESGFGRRLETLVPCMHIPTLGLSITNSFDFFAVEPSEVFKLVRLHGRFYKG